MREKMVSPQRTSQAVSSAGELSSLWSCNLPRRLGHQTLDRARGCREPYTGPACPCSTPASSHSFYLPRLPSEAPFLLPPSLPSPSAIGWALLLAGERPADHQTVTLKGFKSQGSCPTPASSLARLPASQLELFGESLFLLQKNKDLSLFCSLL